MVAAFIRLFALRPFFTVMILGVPLLAVVALGVLTAIAAKLALFVVLPLAVVIWLVRRLVAHP